MPTSQTHVRSKVSRLDHPAAGNEDGRRRAMRVDVRIAKQAMRVVTPTNQQIGPWQARAAHLLAMAEKLRASGRNDPAVGAEAEALLKTVELHRRGLVDEVGQLPADVAASTRLEDTARALQSVSKVLRQTLAVLKRTREPAGH